MNGIEMYSFQKSDGGMRFIGIDRKRKVFSNDFYANVGILNCDEPTKVRLKDIRSLRNECESNKYTEVQYLKGTCYNCKYYTACGDNDRTERCEGKELQ